MTTTSGTYLFKNFDNDELILECFERLGLAGEDLVPVQVNSAKRSLNLLLLDWITKDINLWTIHTHYLSLNTLQSTYSLNAETLDILNVNLRQFNRALNGIAATSDGGDADSAFDGNSLTACTQTTANGNISYTYASNTIVNFIGIQANGDKVYSLVLESSTNGIDWKVVQTLPVEQSYSNGEAVWFDVIKPVSNIAYRIRETGGAILDIQEIYFTNNILDFRLSPISRDTYLSFSQKSTPGRPTSYYFNKQIVSQINIWYPPTDEYKVVQYSAINSMQDAGGFLNCADVPAKMYPALVAGLSWMLSVKYRPEISADLKIQYDEAYSVASANDSENVDFNLSVDVSEYYEN